MKLAGIRRTEFAHQAKIALAPAVYTQGVPISFSPS